MKNYKVIFMGMLALALVFGFAGCQNGTQEVNGAVGQWSVGGGPAPTDVKADPGTVTPVTNSNGVGVLVSWTAVDQAVSYKVYFQQSDRKTIVLSSSVSSNAVLKQSNGSDVTTNNTNPDAWNTFIGTTAGTTNSATTINSGASYRIGVSAVDRLGNESAIFWTPYAARN
ncbi:hypothetical protein AGMMS50268_11810 [Spirochaetia bacterium]|nr:hypothetical protein AGMMS50268_11810 [Spirochaetia bacterium]